jgi:hypothetical protein
VRICDDCYQINDTTSTPGKVWILKRFIGRAMNPPIAFVGADGVLRCALPASPGWQIEIVDTAPMAGGCSLELDANQAPVIAYHDANGLLQLARRNAGTWTHEPIDPLSVASGSTAIVAVPNGLAIAYVDGLTNTLKYVESYAGGGWFAETVAPVGAREAYPSLIADGASRAISYYDAANGDLRLAQRPAAGLWTTSPIDGAGDVGGYTSLVGGPSFGGFGVAYHDFTNTDLKYALGAPGSWTIETVDGAGRMAGRPCSAFAFAGNPNDRVGIAYYDRTRGDLMYALRHGNVWTLTVLDTTGHAGEALSLGGTPVPGDTMGVVYSDGATGNLNYLWRTGTVTAVSTVAAAEGSLRVEWLRAGDGEGGRIRFSVPARGNVRVSVLDALGRLTAMPLRAALPAGRAEVRWDGRDLHGVAARAGIYFVRVETAAGSGVTSALLLR